MAGSASGEIMTKLSTHERAAIASCGSGGRKTKQATLDTWQPWSRVRTPAGPFRNPVRRAYKGGGVATVAGSNVVCGPIEAALANGILAHSDETDDTHPFAIASWLFSGSFRACRRRAI
jgi:hypothetical protein